MKQEFLVQVPTAQYEFVQVKAESPQEAKELRDSILEAWKEPTKTEGLDSLGMLRLTHKYLVTNKLELEDIESLGTSTIYSQRDVITLIKKVFAKIARDGNEGSRADSINRIIQRD